MAGVVDREQLDEETLDEFQRDLIRAVGEGVCRIRMHLHEKAFQAGRNRRARKDGGKFAITARRTAKAAGARSANNSRAASSTLSSPCRSTSPVINSAASGETSARAIFRSGRDFRCRASNTISSCSGLRPALASTA